MSDLERFVHMEESYLPVVIKAGLVHAQFETIHPFIDGNGRVGRLLITLMLYNTEELRQPILYPSLYFKAHRARYYDLLQRVRTHNDWNTWLDFFLDGITSAATQAIGVARAILMLFEKDRIKIGQLGRRAGSALRVHQQLQKYPIITAPIAAKEAGLSLPTVRTSLGYLMQMGLVKEVTGKRSRRAFLYKPYWKILPQGTEPTT